MKFSIDRIMLFCVVNIVLCLFASCAQETEIVLQKHKTITRKINPSESTEPLSLKDFSVDSICSLVLPDSLKILETTKVTVKDDKIYLMDSKYARCVYVFNSSGNYLYKLGSRGRARYEYIGGPIDFFVDKDNSVHVFDREGGKVVVFDKKGLVSHVAHADSYKPYCFGLTSNKRYMFSTIHDLHDNNGNASLILCDYTFRNVQRLLPFKNIQTSAPLDQSFFANEDKLSFIPFFSDSVLVFQKDTLSKVVKFDFGGQFIMDEIPEMATSEYSPIELGSKVSEYNGVLMLMSYQENEDMTLLHYIYNHTIYFWLYNHHTKRIVNTDKLFEGVNIGRHYWLKGKQLITVLSSEEVDYYKEYLKQRKDLIKQSSPIYKDIINGEIKAPFVLYISIK